MAIGYSHTGSPITPSSEKKMSVNITQHTICRVISQQMLYFSQHFAE